MLSLRELRREMHKEQALKRRLKAAEARAAKMLKTQEEICRRVAIGQSLLSVCQEDKAMPSYQTALQWLHDYPDFAEAHKQAQRLRADVLFEEALTVADDARNDWMARNDPNNPGWIANGEHIQRSRLRVDTRKWAASKLNPSRYGDKLAVEGNPDRPVVVTVTHRIVQVVRQETNPLPEPVVIEERKASGWDEEP